MIKQRVYLDTSVLSALHDTRWPDRAELTRAFWERRQVCDVCTSEVARLEVDDTRDETRRVQMSRLLDEIVVHPISSDMKVLARRYVDAGVFPERVIRDALHVAAAVLTRSEVLLSWNFRHLVNRRRRAAVESINLAQGLPSIEIITPAEF